MVDYKNPTQPSPSQESKPIHMDWVGPIAWTNFVFLITIITIKLSIRTKPPQIRANL